MIKCILISFLLCITFSQMGKGNTNESQIQDIESSIIIRTQEKKYFVVQLLRGLTEEGFYTRFLIVKKNKKTIARIAFPSSEDVKNLSVNIMIVFLNAIMVEERIFTVVIFISDAPKMGCIYIKL